MSRLLLIVLMAITARLCGAETITPEQRAQIFESVHSAFQKQAPSIKALYDLELAKNTDQELLSRQAPASGEWE